MTVNVLSRTQCLEHPESSCSALNVITEPTTVAPGLAIIMFVGIASQIIIMRISYLITDVKFAT